MMELTGFHSYIYSQCNDDTVLLGGGFPRLKSVGRVEVPSDGIDGHVSMIKVSHRKLAGEGQTLPCFFLLQICYTCIYSFLAFNTHVEGTG